MQEESNEFHDAPRLRDHEVVDERGQKVGKVTDVIFDDMTMKPEWAVVDVGLLRGEHFVPLQHAYVSDDGRVVVPFAAEVIKKAPKVHGEHVMTPEVRDELARYYGLAA
jgi:sporulation protein YlmC with PRC-barrel domain